MFLEFDCGHFGTKVGSLRPSYQKLAFLPIFGHGRGQKRGPPMELARGLFFGGYIGCLQHTGQGII